MVAGMKLLALITLVLLVAGCGGSSGSSSQSGARILSCLQERYPSASDAEDDLDYIAQAAGDKGIAVEFPRNSVDIAVERSEADAKQTMKAYGLFLSDAGEDQLTRVGSAVVAFDKTPTAEEFGPVEACVRGA
jgi:hypothetical protein